MATQNISSSVGKLLLAEFHKREYEGNEEPSHLNVGKDKWKDRGGGGQESMCLPGKRPTYGTDKGFKFKYRKSRKKLVQVPLKRREGEEAVNLRSFRRRMVKGDTVDDRPYHQGREKVERGRKKWRSSQSRLGNDTERRLPKATHGGIKL